MRRSSRRGGYDYGFRTRPLADPYADLRPQPYVQPATQELVALQIAGSQAFFGHTVSIGLGLLPPLLANVNGAFNPNVAATGAVTIAMYPIAGPPPISEVFPPIISLGGRGLGPPLIVDGDTFYSPTVIGTIALLPPLLSDGETFYVPTVGILNSWILSSGAWNDSGSWNDSGTWNG